MQPQIDDLAMMSTVDDQVAALPAVTVAERSQDEALTVTAKKGADAVGGIDLTPVDIRIQGDGQPLTLPIEGVDTYMYDNISGFTPIIVRMEPLHDPQLLLELSSSAN